MEALDDEYKARVVSAEHLCIGWLETRTKSEMAAYTGIMQIAHAMIAEAFSSRVVHPGVTTNEDVKYFMMQKVIDLGLIPWFDFEVSIRRAGVGAVYGETVIMPGDILHCDVGLKYLNLCTDTQENAYVLKLGETDAPDYLKDALRQVNRFQEIVCDQFKEGTTGNIILKNARVQAIAEGLKPSLYTHPIGYHGHGAGPTLGLWDMQQGVPVQGDYPMYNDTCYSLELNCTVDIKEWNTSFSLGLETDVLFTEDKVHYLAGRQEKFHLIK
jgi:Xaa-Pro aminopeptidase